MVDREGNTFSYLRWGKDGSAVACVVNMSATPHEQYRIGLPRTGTWREIVNTDAAAYRGSGMGNLGSVEAVEGQWHGQSATAEIVLPPLATVWLAHDGS